MSNSGELDGNQHFATRAIHVGQEPDELTGATIPPITATSTYTQRSPGQHKGYEYSRSQNPTRERLERCIASLEGGVACGSFASGSAATTAVLATLAPGDSVVAYADVYGGTFRVMKHVFEAYGIVPVFTDDPTPASFANLVGAKTKMVWLETPTNPLLRVLDIGSIARIAHDNGAMLAVDNTFATPVLQRPIELGADYVLHSTSKYIGGHSDLIGGAVVVNSESLWERIAFLQNSMGAVPGPWDCYLQHRGLKTLDIRMERHSANAMALANHLAENAKLSAVVYPFREDHPDYVLAKKQMSSGGGMVTIVFKGERDAALRFCENVKVFQCAESLGGVESLACHPAIMTHASIPKEIREARGVTDGLVRLSVGIEHIDDLIADVDQAIDKA